MVVDLVCNEYWDYIVFYSVGNWYFFFFGWVYGVGMLIGMFVEMFVVFLNCNVGGCEYVVVYVEINVIVWMCELFGFFDMVGGIFVSGILMVNLFGLMMV